MAPPKRPWFRFYVETLWDAPLRVLPPAQRWVWVTVLALARSSPVAGVLLDKAGVPIPDVLIADAAAVRPADVKAALKRFTELEMVNRDDHDALVVTKWDTRQFESDDVTVRTARHRAAKSTGESPPDGTPEGTSDGTFHAPPDGTESPSVVLAEVQSSTEPLSSETDSGPTAGPLDDEVLLAELWTLLAFRDFEQAKKRGGPITSPPAWRVEAAARRKAAHEVAARSMLAADPSLTAERLAELLDVAEAPVLTIAASESQVLRQVVKAHDCEHCGGRGIYELPSGEWEHCPCKTRPALHAVPEHREAS